MNILSSCLLILIVQAIKINCKIYQRCELASELINKHGFPVKEIGNWICLIESESTYNTRALGSKRDYGLFQVKSFNNNQN